MTAAGDGEFVVITGRALDEGSERISGEPASEADAASLDLASAGPFGGFQDTGNPVLDTTANLTAAAFAQSRPATAEVADFIAAVHCAVRKAASTEPGGIHRGRREPDRRAGADRSRNGRLVDGSQRIRRRVVETAPAESERRTEDDPALHTSVSRTISGVADEPGMVGKAVGRIVGKIVGKAVGRAAGKAAAGLGGTAAGSVSAKAASRIAGKTAGRVARKLVGRSAGRTAGRIAEKAAGKVAAKAAGRVMGRMADDAVGKLAEGAFEKLAGHKGRRR